jgi:ElaB/YqjD/DUF883 family membrane-anchored ribosome-binding protein
MVKQQKLSVVQIEAVNAAGQSRDRNLLAIDTKGFKMNNQRMENKVRQDVVKIKKDLNTLRDRAANFGRLETKVNQVADDVTNLVEDGVTQLGQEFEKLTEDTRDTAAMLKKDVRHGLRQYNAKAQEVASKVPGGMAKKAVKYPWVAISIALLVGLSLGIILKPARQYVEEF